MASEVFAEDIEALLERLDGVAAARVVATAAGEIDRIYVTAEGEGDEATVRRTVSSALMSGYSLAVDGWRIRVARLRPTAPARPRWYMQRMEEVLTPTEVRVSVELRSDEGTVAALVGRARGQPDAASRLRTAALATLDALKSWFEAEDRRATVDSIALTPLAAGRAAIVALSLAGPTTVDRYVGSTLVESSEGEAVIAATLDAVGKRGTVRQRRGGIMRDRRDELESMETHFRRARGPQREMPRLARPPQVAADVPLDAVEVPAPPVLASAPDVEAWEEDEVATLEQIRPERQGGAEVAQPMNRADVERGRFTPKSSMEDDYYRQLVAGGTPVHIRCRDGYEITDGVVKDFGTYSLLVETRGARELVFKHGIISIRPSSAKPTQG